VIEGIIIHKKISNSKLIFTGNACLPKISTAEFNANLAISLGVKRENIIINSNPKDTYEEARFIKQLLKNNEEFILVTSATHMLRSMMLFESIGLKPIAAPTDFKKINHNVFDENPSAISIVRSQIAIHEYLGLLWAKITS
jgi:uncharacterized SAM-binding protein YcdF (DUF218 family)